MSERNQPCPCGSGRKYKACCAVKPTTAQRMPTFLLIVFVVMSGIVLASSYLDFGAERVIPDGYAWSDEHNHMHKIGSTHLAIPDDAVWMAEHGHFHDANGNPIGGATPTPFAPPAVN